MPEAQTELERLVPAEARKWCTIETQVETGVPYLQILTIAEKNRADMVVMNIHGKGMLERALLGSTAERVIRGAPCPVLAIPPRKATRKQYVSSAALPVSDHATGSDCRKPADEGYAACEGQLRPFVGGKLACFARLPAG